jgi:3-methyl-2-oxobutanoate hydroxymethyltransferase
MGHIGLTPQSIHQFGSYRARGQAEPNSSACSTTRARSPQAGAFALVIEKVPRRWRPQITAAVGSR